MSAKSVAEGFKNAELGNAMSKMSTAFGGGGGNTTGKIEAGTVVEVTLTGGAQTGVTPTKKGAVGAIEIGRELSDNFFVYILKVDGNRLTVSGNGSSANGTIKYWVF